MTWRSYARIVNALAWIGVWIGVGAFTNSLTDWFAMLFEALLPLMMGLFIHIALRPHPETPPPVH